MGKRRNVLERYLRIKEEKGIGEALKKLEEDKNLLPKSTYYWVKKKLIEKNEITPINLGEPAIYEIDDRTKIVGPEKVIEAIDKIYVMFEKALLEFLIELEEKDKERGEKISQGVIDALLDKKEPETALEIKIKSYEQGLIHGALGVLENLGLIQYVTTQSNKVQLEFNAFQEKR